MNLKQSIIEEISLSFENSETITKTFLIQRIVQKTKQSETYIEYLIDKIKFSPESPFFEPQQGILRKIS